MRSVVSVAAMGSIPPLNPLAVHSMSGETPACSHAHIGPVLP